MTGSHPKERSRNRSRGKHSAGASTQTRQRALLLSKRRRCHLKAQPLDRVGHDQSSMWSRLTIVKPYAAFGMVRSILTHFSHQPPLTGLQGTKIGAETLSPGPRSTTSSILHAPAGSPESSHNDASASPARRYCPRRREIRAAGPAPNAAPEPCTTPHRPLGGSTRRGPATSAHLQRKPLP